MSRRVGFDVEALSLLAPAKDSWTVCASSSKVFALELQNWLCFKRS